MHKLQRSLLLLGLFTATIALPNTELLGTGYKQLKYWFMRSKGIKQEDLAQDKEVLDESKTPDFSLPTFDEQTRQLMLYDILQTSKTDYFAPVSASAEQLESLKILHRDLEVFCGDGAHPEANIAEITDRTRSAAGSAVHRKMLANPLASSDFKKFKSRQALIQAFVENEELLKKADELCVAMAHNEERMLANWLDADAVSGEVFEKSYFKNRFLKGLNTSPIAMEALTRMGNLGTTWTFTNEVLLYYMYKMTINKFVGKETWGQAFTNTSADLWEVIKNFNPINYYKTCKNFIGELDQKFDSEMWPDMERNYREANLPLPDKDAVKKPMMTTVKAGFVIPPVVVSLWGAWKAYECRNAYNAAKLTKDAINFMQDKLIGLGNLVRSVEELEALGAEYPMLAEGLVSWQHAADLLHRTEKNDFTTLVKLLQTNTFVGESSFFSLSGRVLAANKLVVLERDKFAGAIELMGELDACVSAAKLYKQFEDRRVSFCFANIEQASRPHINLQSFWNPFVNFKVVVANDLELGGSRAEQHVVLTGSNTGGKSTIGLKGTLISVYLAHTLGLAPAAACELSVFTDFSSYIHVVDDVASGESAFQAEINRANSLIKAVKSLSEDQFAFIVIDELFKGTSPEKGAPGARKVVQHLAGHENVVFIIATHFKELTTLADEVDSIVNMKIEIFEDEAGNLIKPYKLEEGVSTHNVADNLMELGLDIDNLNFA